MELDRNSTELDSLLGSLRSQLVPLRFPASFRRNVLKTQDSSGSSAFSAWLGDLRLLGSLMP